MSTPRTLRFAHEWMRSRADVEEEEEDWEDVLEVGDDFLSAAHAMLLDMARYSKADTQRRLEATLWAYEIALLQHDLEDDPRRLLEFGGAHMALLLQDAFLHEYPSGKVGKDERFWVFEFYTAVYDAACEFVAPRCSVQELGPDLHKPPAPQLLFSTAPTPTKPAPHSTVSVSNVSSGASAAPDPCQVSRSEGQRRAVVPGPMDGNVLGRIRAGVAAA